MEGLSKMEMHPWTDPGAIIQGDKYRISILTERLVRFEYQENGHFEDHATQIVINRDFEEADYEVRENTEYIEIETKYLLLRYDRKAFSENGLVIEIKGFGKYEAHKWYFGKEAKQYGNLLGTIRTLDDVNGSCEIDAGLMSREGWSVLDDSSSLLLKEDGWVLPRKDKVQDFYFFGYQSDYKGCLKDYYHLTGKTPMLPRFALGNWWSRYYEYSEESYKLLVERFEKEKIPFSVAVIDMDWHLTDVDSKYGSGWTGFSWNRKLFPEPEQFLDWLHKHGMRITLNLHPADGIRGYEDCYKEAANAMGVSVEREETVEFDVTDRKSLLTYFKYGCHPHEKEGVDFWWIDWQQGTRTKIAGLDSLWMLNHFHFLDSGRENRRPLTFSRYAGPGSHRYPVGFSGDTHITWESLDFQPYFTSTASNIGYGWWSHDIGGHTCGYKDDILECRWYQFGVFSPIMRLHSTKNEFNGKEPWRYRKDIEGIMGDFLRLRHKLIPYLYTMNHRAYEADNPLITPLYYENGWKAVFDQVKNEYYFGTEMIVNPITTPEISNLNVGKTRMWLPKGVFIDFFTGVVYQSEERVINMYRPLESIPVLVKAGGIIPMTEEITAQEVAENPRNLYLRIFAGADGRFTLYEDDNETTNYINGNAAYTDYTLVWGEKKMFTIASVRGNTKLIPQKRCYILEWNSVKVEANANISVLINGECCAADWEYLEEEGKLVLTVSEVSVEDTVCVVLESGVSMRTNPVQRFIFEFLNRTEIDFNVKTAIYEIIQRDCAVTEKLSELQGMELDKDLQGALTEFMTAQAV